MLNAVIALKFLLGVEQRAPTPCILIRHLPHKLWTCPAPWSHTVPEQKLSLEWTDLPNGVELSIPIGPVSTRIGVLSPHPIPLAHSLNHSLFHWATKTLWKHPQSQLSAHILPAPEQFPSRGDPWTHGVWGRNYEERSRGVPHPVWGTWKTLGLFWGF